MRILLALLASTLLAAPAWAQTEGAVVPGSVAPRSGLQGCVYNATPPVAQSGQQMAVQCSPTGQISPAPVPVGSTPFTASSTVVTNATITLTMPAVAGKTNYLCGFVVGGLGATAENFIVVAVGPGSGTAIGFPLVIPTGVTTPVQTLTQNFNPCLPTAGPNQALIVQVPAFGAGSTAAAAAIWGYVE